MGADSPYGGGKRPGLTAGSRLAVRCDGNSHALVLGAGDGGVRLTMTEWTGDGASSGMTSRDGVRTDGLVGWLPGSLRTISF